MVFLALALVLAPATGNALGQSNPSERLARRFARDGQLMVEDEALALAGFELAMLLSEEAVALAPDDVDLWRHRLRLASLADDELVIDEAVERIVALDPSDQVARLRMLVRAVERRQTIEERIAGYEELLAQGLAGPVASRLALELALLHRRHGDESAFAERLSQALQLDPGHRAAAALAAGYFRSRIDDPYGEAELLVNLMLADPAGRGPQAVLGELLLVNGAYRGAARILGLAAATRIDEELPPASDLYIDLAIAQWGSGQPEAAVETLETQRRRADQRLRDFARTERPDMTPMEVVKLTAPMPPQMATVMAAIRTSRPGADPAAPIADANRAYRLVVDREEKKEQPDPEVLARLNLEQAWMLLWLGGDPAMASEKIGAATAASPLTDMARARFDGWIALRRGRAEAAVDLLAPLAADDPAAALGLALARLELGQRREAARGLLAAARAQPGTLMSVWAGERLFELLGARAPIFDHAAPLEQLIASVPQRFDRYVTEPTQCITLRLDPVQPVYAPYEPVIITIELTNNSGFPLAVDPDGPISPNVMIDPTLRIPNAQDIGRVRPMVLDIGRRLTLQPQERLRVPIDLRGHRLGVLLDDLPLPGAVVEAEAMANFIVMPNASVQPGPLGVRAETSPFRVDGVRFTRAWMEQVMADIVQAEHPRNIEQIALLSHIAAAGMRADLPPEEVRLFQAAVEALGQAYAKLTPQEQAWLLSTMRSGPTIDPILAIARKSEQRLVKIAYLLYRLTGPNDPMIDAVRRDADPRLRRFADLSEELSRRRQNQAAR